MAGGAAFVAINASMAAARRREQKRRMQGYYHEHRCPVCNVRVGSAKCFCEDFYCADTDINEDHPIGYARRCDEHVRLWIGGLVVGVIVAVGLGIWWWTKNS